MSDICEQTLAVLKQVPFFQTLSEIQLRQLSSHTETRQYRPGARLLLEGTFGSRVLVLVEGEVAILKRLGAAVVELARQQPVVFLGEMALVEGGLRSATVRAVDRCKTLEISRQAFNLLLQDHPTLALTMVRELSARLRKTDTLLIEGLIAKNAELIEAQRRLEEAYNATLAALGSALDLRDNETKDHSLRVAEIATIIGREMKLSPADLQALWRGAMLHDVGKIGVPDTILTKPGPLTAKERSLMNQHPRWGSRILENIEFLQEALPVVLYHHEWYDGSGYPTGLKGEAIPLIARIFSVADSFDALTSDRPYRKALTPAEARRVIEEESGTHFDPAVVAAFRRVFDRILGVISQDSG